MPTIRPIARGALLLIILSAVVTLAGCGGSPTTAQPTAAAAPAGLGDSSVTTIAPIAKLTGDQSPLDAAPSPDGSSIYFTTRGSSGVGVFRVPAAGGTPEPVRVGSPFVNPVGIATSSDGTQLYIADMQASANGVIFSLPAAGGDAAPLTGSEGRAPRGLDVRQQGGQDMLYFTGITPTGGQPAIYSLAASGGTATLLASGAPLIDPDGIVVTGGGTAYVSDHTGAGGQGRVVKVEGGAVTTVVDTVRLGRPAGVALTLNEGLLLVSSLQADRDNDQVLLVDLASHQSGIVTKVVGENIGSSGGLHRARNTNTFAWADVQRPGRIYRVDP
jgi:sugar lactone lactonase YvrE